MSERMRGSAGGKPLLLLDVDGVINAMPRRKRPRGYTRHMIDAYQIHIHDEIRTMVGQLRDHFDIAWFTMWNDLAAPLIGPHVGLEDIPFVETSWERGWDTMNELGYSKHQINKVFYAKTPLLVDAIAKDERWVWIDDAHSRWDQEYLERQEFNAQNFRLVSTDASVGLAWPDVQRAVEFAQVSPGKADASMLARKSTRSLTEELEPTRTHHPGSAPGRTSAVAPGERTKLTVTDTGAEQSGRSGGEVPEPGDADTKPAPGHADTKPAPADADVKSARSAVDRCPDCGAEMRPVVYSYPSPALFRAADLGELVLGGCCPPELPGLMLACPACGLGPMRDAVRADGTS